MIALRNAGGNFFWAAVKPPIDFFLFDLNGKSLQTIHSKASGRNLIIDMTGMESGIYFYLINTRQALVNGKIEVIK